MKLRKTIQKQVLDNLDNTFFTSDDFIVDFENSKGYGRLIDIEFAHDVSFKFQVYENESRFRVVMQPGEIADQDDILLESIKDILKEIWNWANEIRYELKANGPRIDQVEILKKYIREQIKVDDTSEEFSVSEINELRRKFKELEERVVKLEQDKIITESQLKNFQKGIQQVSSDVEYYPKKTWLRTAPNKLVQLLVAIGKSSEGRKILADGARRLLGLE